MLVASDVDLDAALMKSQSGVQSLTCIGFIVRRGLRSFAEKVSEFGERRDTANRFRAEADTARRSETMLSSAGRLDRCPENGRATAQLVIFRLARS